MKKSMVLFSGIAIFIACQLLFSCKSSIDVVKRHYNPGYYVNISSFNKDKNRLKNPLINANNTLINNTISKSETEIADNYAIINDESSDNITASIGNEISSAKNTSKFSITTPIINKILNKNSFTKINNNLKSMYIVTNNKKTDNTSDFSGHNTGKIFELIGAIIAIIGVLIYLSAFPANVAGMLIGKSLLVIGLTMGFIGMFL